MNMVYKIRRNCLIGNNFCQILLVVLLFVSLFSHSSFGQCNGNSAATVEYNVTNEAQFRSALQLSDSITNLNGVNSPYRTARIILNQSITLNDTTIPVLVGNDIEITTAGSTAITIDFKGKPGFQIVGSRTTIKSGNSSASLTLVNFREFGIKASCQWGITIDGLTLYVQNLSDGIVCHNSLYLKITNNKISAGSATVPNSWAFDPKTSADVYNGGTAIRVSSDGLPGNTSQRYPCTGYACYQNQGDCGSGNQLTVGCSVFSALTTALKDTQVLISGNTFPLMISTNGINPWFRRGIEVQKVMAKIRNNIVPVCSESSIFCMESKAHIDFNHIGVTPTLVATNTYAAATPQPTVIWNSIGVYTPCGNDSIWITRNRVCMFNKGLHIQYGSCNPDPGITPVPVKGRYFIESNVIYPFVNYSKQFTPGVWTAIATVNDVGLYIGKENELLYDSNYNSYHTLVGGEFGKRNFGKLNQLWGNRYSAINSGEKRGDYLMEIYIANTGSAWAGTEMNFVRTCSPELLGQGQTCLEPPVLTLKEMIGVLGNLLRIRYSVQGAPNAYVQVYPSNAIPGMYSYPLKPGVVADMFLDSTGNWEGEIEISTSIGLVALQSTVTQGTSTFSNFIMPLTLCMPVLTSGYSPVVTCKTPTTNRVLNPAKTGYNQFFARSCEIGKHVFDISNFKAYATSGSGAFYLQLPNNTQPPANNQEFKQTAYTRNFKEILSTGKTDTIVLNRAPGQRIFRYLLVFPGLKPTAGIDSVTFVQWQCRYVVRLEIDTTITNNVQVRLGHLDCPDANNGTIRLAKPISDLSQVLLMTPGNDLMTTPFTTVTTTDSVITTYTGLAAGYYMLSYSWSGLSCWPQQQIVRLEGQGPVLNMSAMGLLPCRTTTDSIDVKFEMEWAMKPLLVGTGKRYKDLMRDLRFADQNGREVKCRVLPQVQAISDIADSVLVRIPVNNVLPQRSYTAISTLYGNTCQTVGCKVYVPVCTTTQPIFFDAPDVRLGLMESIASNDGWYSKEVCPGAAWKISFKGQWRSSHVPNDPARAYLKIRALNADGSAQNAFSVLGDSPFVRSSTSAIREFTVTDASKLYYRVMVSVLGCEDSMNIAFQPVDTSLRTDMEAVTCQSGIGSGRQISLVPGYQGPVDYRWTESNLSLSTPGGSRKVHNAGTVVGLLGNTGCSTRTFSYDVNIASPPALAVNYTFSSNHYPECALTGRAAFLASAYNNQYLPGPFRAYWITLRQPWEMFYYFDSPLYAPIPAEIFGTDTTYRVVSSHILTPKQVGDSIILTSSFTEPQDGRFYYLKLVDISTGCTGINGPQFKYIKPDSRREFEVAFSWGPVPMSTTKYNSPVEADQLEGLEDAFAEGQAECRSRLGELALQVQETVLNSPGGIRDTMRLSYSTPPGHNTLYLYDKAGRLAATVPPHGVETLNRNSDFSNHRLISWYEHNSVGEVLASATPDAGYQRMWYDRVGRIRFSRTSQDKVQTQYRYTLYDERGRIQETGLSTGQPDTANINAVANQPAGTKKEYITTKYDAPETADTALHQRYLRNRVVNSRRYQQPDSTVSTLDVVSTHYSYDPHGNVSRVWQELPKLTRKEVAYTYDLVSGKVKEVWANPNDTSLSFGHRYVYDNDNRITQVLTSRKGVYWEKNAAYEYYLHGPLRRTELGAENVQGIDYHYTLQGWLKGINNGFVRADVESSQFPKDVFGMRLDYFVNDFATTGASPLATSPAALTTANSLYNGNIAAWSSASSKIDTNAWGQVYRYDALNRLKTARTFTGNNALAFLSKYSYDQGGNITKLKRHDASGAIIDSMAYSYTLNSASKPLNNKLNSVNDLGNATGMPTGTSAYTYDADGRLSRDVKEKLLMRWTLDNKVAQVTKGNRYIRYWYDASGNRVMKRLHGDTVDYILRDASGNELQRLVRRQNSGASPILMSREASLYGSSRLGTYQFSPNPGNDSTEKRINGKTTYELTDHLGNVRATVSDQKTYSAITGGYTLAANVLSASDLYPYGMAINSRSFAAGTYRYGFNGKENDNEVKGSGNQQDYGLRIYDPRLGRFLSVDPLAASFAWNSPYCFAENSPIWGIDLDGGEFRTYLEKIKKLVQDLKKETAKQAEQKANAAAIAALIKTATTIYPEVAKANEATKQAQFKSNPENSVAILIYEFATGTGKDNRNFNYGEKGSFANSFVQGRVLGEVQSDLTKKMAEMTAAEFKKNGTSFGLEFSPDHAGLPKSVEKHIDSNLSQLFVGGANVSVAATDDENWVIVTITNYTSRNSLMIHQGENYKRDGKDEGTEKPLSTISQTFTFKMKIDPTKFKKEEEK